MKPSVLVTGGAGYIGSHTCKLLARSGFLPVALDNLEFGHRWAVQWGPLVEGDLGDIRVIRQALTDYQVQAVVHFAAYAYVGESMQNPRKYLRANVVNSLNLLDAMVENGVKRIVFSSTCATYGIPRSVPIREDEPLCPVNPYGESKRFVEQALHWYGQAYGLSWAALRYFNAAGADPEAEIGEEHEPETHLIPLVIGAALGQIPQVEVYGTDYPTEDGTALRDYIHVMDLGQAHVGALRYLEAGKPSVALNLGTGKGHSVREVIRTVERVGGRPVPVKETSRRPGDPPVLVADASRAGELLGWEPRYPGLEAIVETAFRWHSERQARAKSSDVV